MLELIDAGDTSFPTDTQCNKASLLLQNDVTMSFDVGIVSCSHWVNSSCPTGCNIWWHRSGSALAQVLASCLTVPMHYPNVVPSFWHNNDVVIESCANWLNSLWPSNTIETVSAEGHIPHGQQLWALSPSGGGDMEIKKACIIYNVVTSGVCLCHN